MGWSFPIGRLFGTQVRLHLTFLPWLAFWAFSGWQESGDPRAAVHAVVVIVALFACVLLHEFGHVLMARRFGIRTRDVTLLPIGGVASMESTGNNPREELLIAVAGPAVNVVIGAGLAAWMGFRRTGFESLDLDGLQGDLVPILLAANVSLLLFNLLPAFPMDGGRVLRALLSWRGDRVRATRIAAVIGRVMAILFAAAGLYLPGNNLLLFIAIFVWIGAGREAAAAQTTSIVHGVPVRSAMLTDFRVLGPFDTLDDASRAVLAGSQRDFPVVAQDELVGLLRHEDLLPALRDRGPETLVREVMRTRFATAAPDAALETVLRAMQEAEDGTTTVPIVDLGRVVGLVTVENLGEFVSLAAALGRRPRARG